jgi:hypothetical protein
MRHSFEVVGPVTRLAEPIVVNVLKLRRPRLGQDVELVLDGDDCEDLALEGPPSLENSGESCCPTASIATVTCRQS